MTIYDRLTYEDRKYRRYDEVKLLLIVIGYAFVHEDELGVQCNSASIERGEKAWSGEQPAADERANETPWKVAVASQISGLVAVVSGKA